MGNEIEEREEHREWLLHAQEAVERPFAMELEYRFPIGRFASFSLIGYDVLACIVTF